MALVAKESCSERLLAQSAVDVRFGHFRACTPSRINSSVYRDSMLRHNGVMQWAGRTAAHSTFYSSILPLAPSTALHSLPFRPVSRWPPPAASYPLGASSALPLRFTTFAAGHSSTRPAFPSG